jgi:hypothetical protein
MELAISSDERANAFVATDMGIPGSNLKIGKASGRSVTLHFFTFFRVLIYTNMNRYF